MLDVPFPRPWTGLPWRRLAARLRETARRLAGEGRAIVVGSLTPPPPGPYAPLRRHLERCPGAQATLTFTALESLLGAPLPDEVWRRAWWANTPGTPQADAWLGAGWRVRWVRRGGSDVAVTFARVPARAPRLPY